MDSSNLFFESKKIEDACTALELPELRSQAESILIEFKKSKNVLEISMFLLENSENVSAKIQSIFALKENIFENNFQTNLEENLILFILNYVYEKHSKLNSIIRNLLLSLLSKLIKKNWFSQNKDELFSKMTTSDNNIQSQIISFLFFSFLIEEFSDFGKCSNILSYEKEIQIYFNFQNEYLIKIFQYTHSQILKDYSQNVSENYETNTILCDLFSKIISFKFKKTDSDYLQNAYYWSDSLEKIKNLIQIYLTIYKNSSSKNVHFDNFETFGANSVFAISIRKLIISLPSITHYFFLNDLNGLLKEDFFKFCLFCLSILISQTSFFSTKEEKSHEILDISQGLEELFTNFSSSLFFLQFDNARSGVHFLEEFTLNILKIYDFKNNDDLINTIFNSLFICWSTVLQPELYGKEMLNDEQILICRNISENIFNFYIQKKCQAILGCKDVIFFSIDKNNDENENEIFEMDFFSLFGQFSPKNSIFILSKILFQNMNCMKDENNNKNKFKYFEIYFHIIFISGNILTENNEGEFSTIPKLIFCNPNETVHISQQLLEICFLFLDDNFLPFFNSHFFEVSIWFLSRWSEIFLFFEEINFDDIEKKTIFESNQKFLTSFNEQNSCFILQKMFNLFLLGFSFSKKEKYLQNILCLGLFNTFVKNKKIKDKLLQLQNWEIFISFFCEVNFENLKMLSPKFHRLYFEKLCEFSCFKNNSNNFFINLIQPSFCYFENMFQTSNLIVENLNNENMNLQLVCLIQRFRGVVVSVSSEKNLFLIQKIISFFDYFIFILNELNNQENIFSLLFKFFCDFISSQTLFLNLEEKKYLCTFILNIFNTNALKTFQIAERNKTFLENSNLKFFSSFLSFNFCIFENQELEELDNEMNQILFYSFKIILPCISHVLNLSKICIQFFSFLELVSRKFAKRIMMNFCDYFFIILELVNMGLQHADPMVCDSCLNCASHFANVYCAFSADVESFKSDPNFQTFVQNEPRLHSALTLLSRTLLQKIFLERCSISFVESSANVFLPLLLTQQQVFLEFFGFFVDRQIEEAPKQKIREILNPLFFCNPPNDGITRKVDRSFSHNFRSMFVKAVIEAKKISVSSSNWSG